MKLLTTIFQAHQLDSVRTALIETGFSAMTVTSVRGAGVHKGTTATYRGAIYKDEFSDCIQIDLAIEAAQVEKAIEVIRTVISSEEDGVLWVRPLERFIHFHKR
ncbi:P-II family nitrogen regulator [Acetobacteraceae bacterium]|nr:P-II family nitrogen regulator [Acetobacteraceae bacterium]